MSHKPIALAAAALVAGFLSLGGAQAANVATGSGPLPAIQKAVSSNVELVARRDGNYRRYWRGNRNYRGGRYYRSRNYYRGGRYWGHGNYWRPRSGVFLGLGLAPFLYGGYGGYGYGGYGGYYNDYSYYRPAGGSHVRYCLNRYRSYDPRSNTFMGYDGYRHRCRSPYRY